MTQDSLDTDIAESETRRCLICDWPLKKRMEDGCIPGNCSYRPRDNSDEWRKLQHRRELLARFKQQHESELASLRAERDRLRELNEKADALITGLMDELVKARSRATMEGT